MKHCTCKSRGPFEVGDKVITDYGRINNGVVQTVTSVRILPINDVSYSISLKDQVSNMMDGYAHLGGNGLLIRSRIGTDGGAICKRCGLRPGSPMHGMADTWFRKATAKEIADASSTCRGKI